MHITIAYLLEITFTVKIIYYQLKTGFFLIRIVTVIFEAVFEFTTNFK